MAKDSKKVFTTLKDGKTHAVVLALSADKDGDPIVIRSGLTKEQAKHMAEDMNKTAVKEQPYPPTHEIKQSFRAKVGFVVEWFWLYDTDSKKSEFATPKDIKKQIEKSLENVLERVEADTFDFKNVKIKVKEVDRQTVPYKK